MNSIIAICDCERGHNGLGLAIRECDCQPSEETIMTPITGKTLIEWGFKPRNWFKNAIDRANVLQRFHSKKEIIEILKEEFVQKQIDRREHPNKYNMILEINKTVVELENVRKVHADMFELMRTPTLVSGAVMPDACPAGAIPVGGVVAAKDAIHPGFHSSDVCCSMAITIFNPNVDPKGLLDAVQAVTHFGPGGRKVPVQGAPSLPANPFLKGLKDYGTYHFATQGDGNHFAFVGRVESTGAVALVTHHGSRGLGAQLYKRGMAVAKRHTACVSPTTPNSYSWIQASSQEGQDYWEALQFVREWTKASHFAIHELAAAYHGIYTPLDWFWNEHNFVFRRDDGLYYHAKGATPSFKGFASDDTGRTLIPLNLSKPILITEHLDNPMSLGFAPHGAGRNMSRTQFLKQNDRGELYRLRDSGLDIRAYSGVQDHSELPSAYKDGDSIVAQIEKYKLARVIDRVIPYGSIMAGENQWQQRTKTSTDSQQSE